MNIGKRIKKIRLVNNLTQKDFANKMLIGQAALSALEKGIRNVTDRNISLICTKFNINEKWLRTGEGNMTLSMNSKDKLNLNQRLKKVRKLIGDTQTEFAEKLGTSRNAIASYELSKVIPNDTFIQLLCAKFNINEDWLRTGEGDMTLPLSREEEIMQLIGKVQGFDNVFAKILLSFIANLDDSDWITINKIRDSIKKY